ncbi:MAG: helix-turn-helix transcriptional regulator [Methanosphaera sp.]|nr:helix-turn-helix transcriptional regulator [Methanosphaera sp.]
MAKRGETQRTIAKLLEKSPQSISKKFNGRSQWSISEVDKICEHYNKDYYELFKKKD